MINGFCARIMILKYLFETDVPLSTQAIADLLRADNVKISKSGIYKIIEKFKKEGWIINHTKSGNGNTFIITVYGQNIHQKFDLMYHRHFDPFSEGSRIIERRITVPRPPTKEESSSSNDEYQEKIRDLTRPR